jgi:prepilin-type N-terminal cleavage/methylation domain-containing protein
LKIAGPGRHLGWPGRTIGFPLAGPKGYSLIEILFVTALVATLAAATFPRIDLMADQFSTVSAARYLTTRLQRARADAIVRSSSVGIRFERRAAFRFASYADGNGNGVLASDIERGVDARIGPDERLSERFPGVRFGTVPGLPTVDVGGQPPGSNPVRVGASDMLVFTPLGTATPGSLYVLGRRDTQLVVRIFGDTGRTRILRFEPRSRRWRPL